MSLELPTLLQRYQLDTSQAVGAARHGVGALSSLGGAFHSVRGLIEGAGIALGTFKLGEFLKESVQEASHTEQSVKSVTAIFGENAEELIDWAEKGAAAFGIAKGPALQYAEQLGNVLKGFGFIPGAAADMSLSLEKVAADVAIFRHQDPSQVIGAFRAGLYGASRGLRQYGIDTSAVAVHNAALSLGIKTATKEWDAQTKAQVYYALIMRGTQNVVGTASKRQHDLAIESKVLTAELSNLRDRVGTAVLPIMSAFIGFIIRDAVPAIEKFANWTITAGRWMWEKFAAPVQRALGLVRLGIAEFVAGVTHPTANLDAFGWIGTSIIGAGQTVRRVFDGIKDSIQGFLHGFDTGGAGGFAEGFVGGFERVGAAARHVFDQVNATWDKMSPVLSPVFKLITDFLDSSAGKSAVATGAFTILGVSIAALASGPILSTVSGLATTLAFVWQAVKDISFATFAWVAVIAIAVGALVYLWKTSDRFRESIHRIIDFINREWVPKIQAAAGVVKDYLVYWVSRAVDVFERDWLPAIKDAAGVVKDFLVVWVGRAADAFQRALPYIKDFGGLLISGVAAGARLVADAFVVMLPYVESFGTFLLDVLRKVVPLVADFASAFARDLFPALQAVYGFVKDNIAPILAGLGVILGAIVTSAIIDGLTALVGVFTGLATAIGAALSPVVLIVAGLALLAAGAVYAYQHFDGFRAVVDIVAGKLADFAGFIFTHFMPAVHAISDWFEDNRDTIAKFALAFLIFGGPLNLLIAGLVLAYQHFDTFREKVDEVAASLRSGGLQDFAKRFGHDVAVGFGIAVGIFKALVTFVRSDLIPVLLAIGVVAWDIVQGAIIPAFQEAWKTVSDVVGQISDFIKEHWDQIREIIVVTMTVVGAIIKVTLLAAQLLWNVFGKEILSITRNIFKIVGGVIRGSMEILLGIIGFILDLITFHWGDAWHDLGHIVHGAFVVIQTVVAGALKILGNLLRAVMAGIGALWRGNWEVMKTVATGIWDGIKAAVFGGLSAVWSVITTVGGWITSAFNSIWSGFGAVASAAFSAVAKAIEWVWNHVVEPVINTAIRAYNDTVGLLPGTPTIHALKPIDITGSAPAPPPRDIPADQQHASNPNAPLQGAYALGGLIPGVGPVPILAHGGEGVLKASTVRQLASDLFHAAAPAPTQRTDEEHGGDTIIYDTDIYPNEHTLTERGLVSSLRHAERHGTLHSQTGVPRRVRGGRR